MMTYAMPDWYYTLLPVILLWSLFWKAWALWIAARKGQKIWYVVLLVVNLIGVLEILYIFVFSKKGADEKKDNGASANVPMVKPEATITPVSSIPKDEENKV